MRSVRKPPGTRGDANGELASSRASATSTRVPHGAVHHAEIGDPAVVLLVVGALRHVDADRAEPAGRRVERLLARRFEADVHGVVARAVVHDDASRLAVGPPRVILDAGDETDDPGEEVLERGNVGDLDAEVAELDVVRRSAGHDCPQSALPSSWCSVRNSDCVRFDHCCS